MEKSAGILPSQLSNTKAQYDNININDQLISFKKQFDDFRKKHPRQTKIPDNLRQVVLAAVQSGVPEQAIRKACGITSSQLHYWLKSFGKSKAIESDKVPEPQIFEIHDDQQIPNASSSKIVPQQTQPMEIRLSGWSISISPIGQ